MSTLSSQEHAVVTPDLARYSVTHGILENMTDDLHSIRLYK